MATASVLAGLTILVLGESHMSLADHLTEPLNAKLTQPMASLPTTIFQFALSAYDDWQRLAWVGALLIAVAVLFINIVGRVLARETHRP